MKLTKYEHACFTLEHDDQVLVVDPGSFTTDFIAPSGVLAVVITHEHGDHFDHEHVATVMNENPEAVIIAHPSVTAGVEVFATKDVMPGDTISVGPFNLKFFGGEHAEIHPDIPRIANLGVLIGDLLYYPGDSLVRPEEPIDTLALPIAAPWVKASEVIDFARDVRPRLAFPTHDGVLSDTGKALFDRVISGQLDDSITYQRIEKEIEL